MARGEIHHHHGDHDIDEALYLCDRVWSCGGCPKADREFSIDKVTALVAGRRGPGRIKVEFPNFYT
jgi:ABC-type nitrate/sulfonate/bicarbonate transport system ATPase subunit